MDTPSFAENSMIVAACGLYCGACRKHIQGNCPGCSGNEKAQWCKIRACCREHVYRSCADCPGETYTTCKKFNNLIGKVFALLFRSARPVVSPGSKPWVMSSMQKRCTKRNV